MKTSLPSITYLPDDDILYLRLREGKVGRTIDDGDVWRNIDRDANGAVLAAEFVNASRGINLRGLPDEIEQAVREGGRRFPILV